MSKNRQEENKAREILEELHDFIIEIDIDTNNEEYSKATDEAIDQALHSLYELIKREMPKKKKPIFYQNETDNCDYTLGYNQSLSDQSKTLKDIFEEK